MKIFQRGRLTISFVLPRHGALLGLSLYWRRNSYALDIGLGLLTFAVTWWGDWKEYTVSESE